MKWQINWLDETGQKIAEPDIVDMAEFPSQECITETVLSLMAEPEAPASIYGEYGEHYVDWSDGESAHLVLIA